MFSYFATEPPRIPDEQVLKLLKFTLPNMGIELIGRDGRVVNLEPEVLEHINHMTYWDGESLLLGGDVE